jgi:hypothetical protein
MDDKIQQAATDLKTSVDIIAAKGIGSKVIQMNIDYLSQQLQVGKMPIATAIVLGDLLLMYEAILEMQQATG